MIVDGPLLSQLATRLRSLEDERDITDTINCYSHAIDYGVVGEWLDCFTPEGVIEVQGPARPVTGAEPSSSPHPHYGRHEGRQQLKAFIEAQSRPPEAWHKHVVSQTRIVLDGDTAAAVSYLNRIDGSGGQLRLYSMGRYVDRLIRSPDGRWRIAERIVELEAVHPTPP
jgi:hypothetical protein